MDEIERREAIKNISKDYYVMHTLDDVEDSIKNIEQNEIVQKYLKLLDLRDKINDLRKFDRHLKSYYDYYLEKMSVNLKFCKCNHDLLLYNYTYYDKFSTYYGKDLREEVDFYNLNAKYRSCSCIACSKEIIFDIAKKDLATERVIYDTEKDLIYYNRKLCVLLKEHSFDDAINIVFEEYNNSCAKVKMR